MNRQGYIDMVVQQTFSNVEMKDLELYGAGFGVLQYQGKPIDWIANFQDSGQPALGQPIDVMTINDQRPRGIITPQAIQSGTLQFVTYGLNEENVWGSIFNGLFKNAEDLVDIFRQQLENGAIQITWVTLDVSGRATKAYTYDGLVVTDARRQVNVDNNGAKQATQQFTCKYTRVITTTRS